MNPFESVKDSSIWYKPTSLRAVNALDNRIYFGVVREARNDQDTNEVRYLVEIRYKNDVILSNCRMLRRWGGAFNYEDYILQGYNYNGTSNSQNGFAAVPGDIVIVGQLGGQSREGIILGGLTHKARKSFLDVTLGPQYKSEFNGIETWINEEGEYTLTFKGQPTNLNVLSNTPDKPVPDPKYDTKVGSGYFKWDKTGSFTISDNAIDADKFQQFFIDKKNGTLQLDSGKVSLKFAKGAQSVVLTCKTSLNNSKDSITFNTKDYEGEATDHIRLKTPLFVVESGNVRLGSKGAGQQLVNGNTYRSSESSKHNTEKSGIATELSGASLLSSAGSQLAAAGALMTIPVAGAVMAGPMIAAAGAQLAAAGAMFSTGLTAVDTAITTFEGQASSFLSNISKTDP